MRSVQPEVLTALWKVFFCLSDSSPAGRVPRYGLKSYFSTLLIYLYPCSDKLNHRPRLNFQKDFDRPISLISFALR